MAAFVPLFAEVLRDLYARVPMGMRLGLDPLRAACKALHHPERAFEVVHVAGTNGKGSVSAMVAAIARARGVRTGLYTSPHLARFAERIRIDGDPIEDASLAPLLAEILRREPQLTFFEVATLAAFVAFREARVELAVLEVGLGGRLDATNVVPTPRTAAITRIALDHTDRLGSTLEAIAAEKAGIAKPGLEIVLGPMKATVRAAIDEVAYAAGATTVSADLDPEASRFAKSAAVGLVGEHQRDNATVAYVLGERIGASPEERAHGIRTAAWPGRLETVRTPRGDVLLDAAHNPDGIDSLLRYVEALRLPSNRLAFVFGVLADKDWGAMLGRLASHESPRFYVRPSGGTGGRGGVEPSELARKAPGRACASIDEALSAARETVGEGGLVVVAGSILLVGEVRSLLLGVPRDPPVAL
jgi:dihydrofolate synthase/folylpolyglutamate synthase